METTPQSFTPPVLPDSYASQRSPNWITRLPWIFGAIAAIAPIGSAGAFLVAFIIGWSGAESGSDGQAAVAIAFFCLAIGLAVAWAVSLIAAAVTIVIAVSRGHRSTLWSLVLIVVALYPLASWASWS